MGNSCSINEKQPKRQNQSILVIGTLNYGGILNSPFQFFSNQSKVESQISNTFRRLLPIYFPTKVDQISTNKFKWDIGKIDQKLQKQRYTPIYNKNVGIIQIHQSTKLIDSQKFQQLWDKLYSENSSKVVPQPTKQQILFMKTFDLICYHALLAYLYPKIQNKTFQNNFKLNKISVSKLKLNPSLYQELLNNFFRRSYLNEDRKIAKIEKALKKTQIDVLFLQQPTLELIKSLETNTKFLIKHNGDGNSMILIRKQKFQFNIPNYKTQIEFIQKQQIQKGLDVLLIGIQNYIFGSLHLSSKKQVNQKDVKKLKQFLRYLLKKYKYADIIFGGDVNSFTTNEKISEFEVYTNSRDEFTNKKMRTYLQPQFHKANELSKQCKDQIFSTLPILQAKIETINQEIPDQNDLLPTDEHPFDHFLVVCGVQTKKYTQLRQKN